MNFRSLTIMQYIEDQLRTEIPQQPGIQPSEAENPCNIKLT
jgi:hypothetical protein